MTSIAFTGDIAFSKYFAKGYENPNLMDGEIVDFLQTADHVVANVEAPVTGGDIQSERKLNHVNPPEAVPLLLHLNARIWNLANNHTMDCREQGMRDTLDMAAQNGVATLGAGMCKKDAARIVELPGSGGIGLFSVTYYRDFLKAGEDTPGCITCDDLETIQKNISEIKSRNRWCVMVVHDGGEFSNMPMPFFRRRYHEDHNIVEVRAVTAVPMNEKLTAALKAKLEATLGKTVELSCKVDPACMGGVLLELPGRQLDGTVKNRLEGLAASLKAAAM